MIIKTLYFQILIIVLLIFFSLKSSPQNKASQYKYRIQFTDKINSPYSISNPSQFLSPKAILRRNKQNISIRENDIPINPFYFDSISKTGVRIINKSKWLNYITIDKADSIQLKKIKTFPFVSKVEMVYKSLDKNNYKKLSADKAPKPYLSNINSKLNYKNKSNKGDVYKYGYSYDQVNMLECDSLHSMGYRGRDITIAVLDAGFLMVDSLAIFDTIRENGRILGTKDFVNIGGNVYNVGSHGMMVLSTMAGNIPDLLIGTAPDANYWLLRTEDGNSEYIIEEDNWVSAAEFADSVGVDIINSSLGYDRFMDSSEDHSYSDLNGKTARISIAASIAAEKGIIVVNSAGNEGQDQSWGYHISVPADADSIITVGAVDIYGRYVSFSSRGPSYDGRLKPEVAAMGSGVAVSNLNGDFQAAYGTSFSSPLIAGLAACLWQSNPEKSNMKVINSIFKSCNHYSYPDIYTGYGIPNAYKAYLILSEKDKSNFEFNNSVSISSYPYSNDVSVTFILSENSDINAEIIDITGKLVYKSVSFKKPMGYNYITLIKYKELSKGIYFIKIYANNNVYIKKLLKLG